MTIAATIGQNLNIAKHSLKLAESFLHRNNPIVGLYNTIITSIKDVLTSNKKLKIAKYRVNHLQYRLFQMEQVIDQGNPYNHNGGEKINFLR